MPHPIFESLPDRSMAEACSQPFNEAGAYKFTTSREVSERYGDQRFPPVQTEMVSVIASYLEDSPEGVFASTKFATLSPNVPTATEIADLYQDTVGNLHGYNSVLQDLANVLPEFESVDAIKRWCVETTRNNGKRLVAAHFVGRVVGDGSLIDSLTYPTEIMQGLPLILRNSIVAIKPYLDAYAEEYTSDAARQATQETIRRVLRGDAITESLGAVAVSAFLPNPDRVRALLHHQLG